MEENSPAEKEAEEDGEKDYTEPNDQSTPRTRSQSPENPSEVASHPSAGSIKESSKAATPNSDTKESSRAGTPAADYSAKDTSRSGTPSVNRSASQSASRSASRSASQNTTRSPSQSGGRSTAKSGSRAASRGMSPSPTQTSGESGSKRASFEDQENEDVSSSTGVNKNEMESKTGAKVSSGKNTGEQQDAAACGQTTLFGRNQFLERRSPYVHDPPQPEERRSRIPNPRCPRDYIINLREDLADFQESHGLPRTRDYSFMSLGLALAQETGRAIFSVFLMITELFPIAAIVSLIMRFALDKLIDILETDGTMPRLKKSVVFALQMIVIMIPLWILIGTIIIPLLYLILSIFRKVFRLSGKRRPTKLANRKAVTGVVIIIILTDLTYISMEDIFVALDNVSAGR